MPASDAHAPHALLLIDTCSNDASGVALAVDGVVIAEAALPERSASAALLDAVQHVLREGGKAFGDVNAIGVVSGPGSFTGIRVGLAAAKGFCLARNLPLAAVSRLEVLAEAAAEPRGWAALDAGRGEVYARRLHSEAAEELLKLEDLRAQASNTFVVVDSAALAAKLAALDVRVVPLRAASALKVVQRSLAAGGSDLVTADANYVRGESQIYASKASAPAPKPDNPR